MRRVKLTEVLLTIAEPADGEDFDLEIDEEAFDLSQLAYMTLAKISAELQPAEVDSPCSVTIVGEMDWENASLEELRSKPARTRQQH